MRRRSRLAPACPLAPASGERARERGRAFHVAGNTRIPVRALTNRDFSVEEESRLDDEPGCGRRRGLAPLELVLVLPILAMLMALMINFGVIAAWKIRTQGNAHYAAFRSVQVRTGEWNPAPANWPRATLSQGTGASLPTVQGLWDADPDTAHPRADWIRGDWLAAPGAVSAVHVAGRLEFDDGVHTGTAQVERPVPLMRGTLPNGQFRFDLTNELLDQRWQYHTLGIGDNQDSRTRAWWDIEHTDLAALDPRIAQMRQRLDAAQQRLRTNRSPQFLYPLDRDVEFWIYRQGWREFHPRLSSGCSLDVNEVRLNQGQPLVDQINQLPCSMSQAYLGLYRGWICRLERCGATDQTIAPLRDRYNDLRQFVNALPRDMNCGSVGPLEPCDPCDPMDAACWSQCPAPIPDADGL